jgi:thioredoxin-like negative regulator of GroEL
MSSEYNHERLETLQKNYRCAWTTYAAAVECLQSAQQNGDSERALAQLLQLVETAATDYRVARDEMALFLLELTPTHPEYMAESEPEPQYALRRTA